MSRCNIYVECRIQAASIFVSNLTSIHFWNLLKTGKAEIYVGERHAPTSYIILILNYIYGTMLSATGSDQLTFARFIWITTYVSCVHIHACMSHVLVHCLVLCSNVHADICMYVVWILNEWRNLIYFHNFNFSISIEPMSTIVCSLSTVSFCAITAFTAIQAQVGDWHTSDIRHTHEREYKIIYDKCLRWMCTQVMCSFARLHLVHFACIFRNYYNNARPHTKWYSLKRIWWMSPN